MKRQEKIFYVLVAIVFIAILGVLATLQVNSKNNDGVTIAENQVDMVDASNIFVATAMDVVPDVPESESAESNEATETTEIPSEIASEAFVFTPYDFPPDESFDHFPLGDEFQEYIYNLCGEYSISYAFVISVIWRESMFDPNAKNGNCKGLMQINEPMHKDRMEKLGVTDLYNTYENVKTGIDYLSYLFNKYQDCHVVLMAYNGGESYAKRLINKGIYSTSYSRWICDKAIELTDLYGY